MPDDFDPTDEDEESEPGVGVNPTGDLADVVPPEVARDTDERQIGLGSRSLDVPGSEPLPVEREQWRAHVREILHRVAAEGAREVDPHSETRVENARRYADFLIERYEEFPDLAPQGFVDSLPPPGTPDRQIELFYGYYRRLPGAPAPGRSKGTADPRAPAKPKKKSAWD